MLFPQQLCCCYAAACVCVYEHVRRREEEVGSCGRKILSLQTDVRGGWLTEVKLLGKGCEAAPLSPLPPPSCSFASSLFSSSHVVRTTVNVLHLSLTLSLFHWAVSFPWVSVEYGEEWSQINSFLSLVCVCSHASGLDTLSDSTSSTTANDLDLIFLKGIMESPVVRTTLYCTCMRKCYHMCVQCSKGHSGHLRMDRLMDESMRKDFNILSWMPVTVSAANLRLFYACKSTI